MHRIDGRKSMKALERILLPVLVILPILILGAFPIAPQPVELSQAWTQAGIFERFDFFLQAADAYRTILEFQPERVDLWERIGNLEFKAEEFNQAIASYQIAHKNLSLSPTGWLNLGISYSRVGDTAAANSAFLTIVGLPAATPEILASAAQNLRQGGDYEGLLLAARRWLEVDPESASAAWTAGMMLSLQDLPEAARLLAFAANSDGPQAEMARSLLETLGQAVLQPDPAYQLVLVGQRLADLGQWDIAEFAFQKAVASSPDYAEAWAMLGESRQHLGKDGWPDLLRARRIAPDSDIVLSALTLYWNRQNQPKVALVYLKKLAAKHPTEGKWQTEIGSTLAQSGDLIAAMTAFQQAVSIEPQNAQLWRNLAVFSAAYGFDFAAYSQPAIDRALSLAPKDARVLDAAGWIYLTNSDLKSAERFLQQAVAEDGGFAAAKLHLAQVYLAQNRFSIALPLLKEAAGQASDAGTALQAQRLLDQNFPGQ